MSNVMFRSNGEIGGKFKLDSKPDVVYLSAITAFPAWQMAFASMAKLVGLKCILETGPSENDQDDEIQESDEEFKEDDVSVHSDMAERRSGGLPVSDVLSEAEYVEELEEYFSPARKTKSEHMESSSKSLSSRKIKKQIAIDDVPQVDECVIVTKKPVKGNARRAPERVVLDRTEQRLFSTNFMFYDYRTGELKKGSNVHAREYL